ncbi:MAG: polyphosphate polymerase domain-containing protein [Campylobacterota bacterium]|nr:polyphosphate polymerase domain-containing protein [Campylobacterota bacterium]
MGSSGGSFFNSLDRYELKYIISPELVEPITQYLYAFCELDYHSQHSEDHFYYVNSLYYDSPNFLFLKNRLYGKNPRFNMRTRSYGEHPKPPFFLEIKAKNSGTVNKYRAVLRNSEWPNMFSDPEFILDPATLDFDNKELFHRTLIKYNVEPKIFTQYQRRAFVSVIDEYTRVTMDINLQYYLEKNYNVIPDPEKLTHYDNELTFSPLSEDAKNNVILEIKCLPHQIPLWVIDMIRYFQLSRTSFSKYAQSILAATQYDPFFKQHYNFNDRTVNFPD